MSTGVGDAPMLDDLTRELQQLLRELEEMRDSVRAPRTGDGNWCSSERFDDIGEELLASSEQCLVLVAAAERTLAEHPCKWWHGFGAWRRGKSAARQFADLRYGFERLNAAARKWPKFNLARVTEARQSIAAGHSVELKDVLRELRAPN